MAELRTISEIEKTNKQKTAQEERKKTNEQGTMEWKLWLEVF